MPIVQLFGSVVSAVGIVVSTLAVTLPASANRACTFLDVVSVVVRGECMSRVLVHLVPESGVMALSPSRDVALILGPSVSLFRPGKLQACSRRGGLTRMFNAEPAELHCWLW